MAKKPNNEHHDPRSVPTDADVADGQLDPRLVLDYDPRDPRKSVDAYFGTDIDILPSINRRTLLKAGALAALGSALPHSPQAWAEKPVDEVVRICHIPITDAAALLIAHDKGFFKDEGLDSERPVLIRGWSPLVEAFQAHKFNLTHLLNPIPIWMRYNNKFPLKMTAWDHTNGSACVVGAHTDIKSFKDFGQKQVAVPWWYSNHNIILQMLLRDAGITPVIRPQDAKLAPNECNLLVLAPPDMPPAIASRKIDAYIVAEPFNALGELKAGAKMLRFTGDVWKGHPCCVVVMHEADVEDPARAAWTQAIHNAVIGAQIWISENREEAAKRLSRDGGKYLPFPFEVINRAMNFYDPAYYNNPLAIKHVDWGQDRINMQGWPYPSATKFVTEQLKQVELTGDRTFLDNLSADHVVQDLTNFTFVKKALEKYPQWRKDPSVPQSGDPYVREEVIEV